MKNISISVKRLFIALLLVVSMLFAGNVAVFSSINTASAYKYQETSSVSVKNGDFNSYTQGANNMPYSLESRNWALSSSSSVTAGVIEISDERFKSYNYFGLLPAEAASNPKTSDRITNADNFILMFRSAKSGTPNSGDTAGVGSATSDTFTFTQGKYFRLSVQVRTRNGALASIYMTGDNGLKIENISTNDVWKTYSFYVATDDYNNLESTLKLCFGGSNYTSAIGAVFFDHVQIDEISSYDYFETINNLSNTPRSDIAYMDNTRNVVASNFQNGNFENGQIGWNVAPLSGSGVGSAEILSKDLINLRLKTFDGAQNSSTAKNYSADTFVYGNTNSLFFLNTTKTTTTVSSDNSATLMQHKFYVLSFLYKTGDISGAGLKVTLTPENQSDKVKEISVSSLVSGSGQNAYNGFEIKKIYLKGSVEDDQSFSISFSLPDTSGWAIVDDVKLTLVTQKEYADNAKDSEKLDFSANITDTNNILNGNFWFTDNQDINESYPLTPQNWTYSAGSNNAKSGIIRINPTYFEMDRQQNNYGTITNPGINTAALFGGTNSTNHNESVLMIRNKTMQDATYTSGSVTISSNRYESASTVKISVGVKTVGNTRAFVKLVDKNGKIIAILDDILSPEWTTYSIYVKNGLSELSANLVLGVEGNGNDNHAFFDFVKYESSNTDDISKIENRKTFYYLNLFENDFTSHSQKKNSSDTFGYYGFDVLDNTQGSSNYYGVKLTGEREGATDKSALYINNFVEDRQLLITNYTYSLSTDSYYEISVWVKTNFSNATFNREKFGGHFELVTVDESGNIINTDVENKNKFSNIVVTQDGVWQKYSIYILCESSQKVKVVLGLGTESSPTQGEIYFDDLVVRDITKEEYAKNTPELNTIVSKTISLPAETDGDEDEDTASTSNENINIWALVSSILLVVALVFALAGYAIRQIPKKKVKKVTKKSNYVIEIKKVKEQDIAEELKLKRQTDLANLKKELSDVKGEYDGLRDKYEKDTADKDEVESRGIYKEYAFSANTLLSRIDYLNSAIAYLNDPYNIRQTLNREVAKRNRQSKIEYERKMQEEYQKINNKEEVKNNTKKK